MKHDIERSVGDRGKVHLREIARQHLIKVLARLGAGAGVHLDPDDLARAGALHQRAVAAAGAARVQDPQARWVEEIQQRRLESRK